MAHETKTASRYTKQAPAKTYNRPTLARAAKLADLTATPKSSVN
jgi:hypothetical protein